MAPDAFEQMIREGMDREKKEADSGIRFTNGKDATEVVIPQYKRGFLRLMGQASALSYGRLNWGDREAQTLAAALVYAHAHGALAQLTVRSHTRRPEARGLAGVGCAPSPWLCVCVCADPWQTLYLDENQIGDAGVASLADARTNGGLTSLKTLKLGGNTVSSQVQETMEAAMAKNAGSVSF